MSSAPRRSALRRGRWCAGRGRPGRCPAYDGPSPRTDRLTARSASPTEHGQAVEVGVEDLAGSPGGVAGRPPSRSRGQLRAGRERGGLVEQAPASRAAAAPPRRPRTSRRAAVAPPRHVAPPYDDLRDVLAGAEALVGRAAAHPGLAQRRVDRAAVGRVEVAARLTGVLGEGEAVRGPERQGDAAQPDALPAVRLEGDHVHMDTVGRHGTRDHTTPAQRRHHDPRGRLRHLRAQGRGRRRGRPQRPGEGLPAHRHRGELRQRGRGRRGDPPLRRPARRDRRDQQDPRPPPRLRRRDRQHPRVAGAARARPDRRPPHPLAQPEAGEVRRGVARAGRSCATTGWSAPPASRTSPRSTSPGHRRHRRDAGAQPDRAAPLLPAGRDARRPRRARRRDRVVEPVRAQAGGLRRGRRSAAPPRRTASPPARWCCAGTSSSTRCRSPSRRPRSGSAQNLDLDGFELTDDEMAAITGAGPPDGRWFGGDPDTHEEI